MGVVLLALVMAACGGEAPTEMPEPTPGDTLAALGPEATGEIFELRRGDAHGAAWRYAVYPSADGWCLQLELQQAAGVTCGADEPEEGQAFAGVSFTEAAVADEQVVAVDGVASLETTTVWAIADGGRGRRIPALLMPLDRADIEAQAFLVVLPSGMNVTHLQAVALNGRVLETYELP